MNAPLSCLLAQDVGGILKLIVLLVFVLITVLGQLASRGQERGREVGRRGRPGPPPGNPPRRDPLADEIGEFLQQTARRRAGQQEAGAAPGPQPPGPSAALATPLTASPPRRPGLRPGGTGVETPWPPQPADPLASPSGARVAEHVRSYLDTGDIVQETAGLGRDVALADEKMEQHLREAFTHPLGRLAAAPAGVPGTPSVVEATAAPTRPQPGAATRGLAALLRKPGSVRQAVLLSEILNRPEHRWS